MKYTSIGFLGFLLGAAGGLTLLYFNPLTARRPAELTAADRALHYELPEQVLAFVHGERALLPGAAGDDDPFWEGTIDRSALLALALNDADGSPTAVASRLLHASPRTDLLLRGVLVSDHWLLTIPGEGSLFLRVDTNLWPFLKEAFIPTWYFGQPLEGPAEYRPTVGPGPRTAVVLGATGRFAQLQGSALETYRVTALDRDRRAVALDGALYLDLLEGPVVADRVR